MLSIDLIGLLITVSLVGIRYPHYVILAALANSFAQFIMALFLHGNIEAIIAAGAFGSVVVNNSATTQVKLLIALSGPAANYYFCKLTGGIAYIPTIELISPVVKVRNPLSVINFRFAVITICLSIYNIVVR